MGKLQDTSRMPAWMLAVAAFCWGYAVNGAHSGWTLQNPSLTPHCLNDIFFVSPDEGWIVGDKGIVLHTADSGRTWAVQPAPMDYPPALLSVFFHDGDNGWAAGGTSGRSYILRTNDGGRTYTDASAIVPDIPVRKVLFQSGRKGWLVLQSRENNLLVTEDGGDTWSPVDVSGSLISDIVFVDDSVGFAAGDMNYIGRTTDGGRSWTQSDVTGRGPFHEIEMTDRMTGYCISIRGCVVKTTDGGVSWDTVLTTGLQLNCIHFSDSARGFVTGGYSPTVVFRTQDGGTNWQYRETDIEPQISALFMGEDGKGWAGAWNGAVYAVSGMGDGFSETTSGTGPHTRSVDFLDSCRGLVGQSDGHLLATYDGGIQWDRVHIPTRADITRIMYFNKSALAVIYGDTCAVSADGGRSWAYERLPLFRPGGGRIAGTDSGYLAKGNTLLMTHSAAQSWSQSQVPYLEPSGQQSLSAIFFSSDKDGWACGNSGTVIRTNDGGLSWDSVSCADDMAAEDIFFVDARTGWIGGHTGSYSRRPVILRSDDGGATWKKQGNITFHADHSRPADVGFEAKILKIRAINPDTAWALSDAGVLRTADGGQHWSSQRLPQYGTTLFDMHLGRLGYVWVVGAAGAVWRYADNRCCSAAMHSANPGPERHGGFGISSGHGSLHGSRLRAFSLLGRKVGCFPAQACLSSRDFNGTPAGIYTGVCAAEGACASSGILIMKEGVKR